MKLTERECNMECYPTGSALGNDVVNNIQNMTFGMACCNSFVKRCFCNCKFLEFPELGTTTAFDPRGSKQNPEYTRSRDF